MEENTRKLTQFGLPTGTIIACIQPKNNTLPKGWLWCDGSPIPNHYQELIELLQSKNTPNLNGRTLIGSGKSNSGTLYNLHQKGGEEKHTLRMGEMPPHDHDIQLYQGRGGNGWANSNTNGSYYTSCENTLRKQTTSVKIKTESNGGNKNEAIQLITQPHNNMQPYYVMNYIIFGGIH